MVFNLNHDDDSPISSVKQSKSESDKRKIPLIREAFKFMTYLPVLVIASTIACDFASLHIESKVAFGSPLRLGTLGQVVHGQPSLLHYVYGVEVFASVVLLMVTWLVRESRRYDVGTRDVLTSFRTVLEKTGSIPQFNSES